MKGRRDGQRQGREAWEEGREGLNLIIFITTRRHLIGTGGPRVARVRVMRGARRSLARSLNTQQMWLAAVFRLLEMGLGLLLGVDGEQRRERLRSPLPACVLAAINGALGSLGRLKRGNQTVKPCNLLLGTRHLGRGGGNIRLRSRLPR